MTQEKPPTEAPPVHASIGAAKIAVMAEVKRLEKLHENTHGQYQFASIDDFKDMIRPLLVKHGIEVSVTQEDYEIVTVAREKKETIVAKIKFGFVLSHPASKTSAAPTSLTVCLPYTGAQTSGAALSYALKEAVYKGTFQASSGDLTEEADLHDQDKFAERLSKKEAQPVYEALTKELRDIVAETRDYVELQNWWSKSRSLLATLPADWFIHIKTEYADEWKALKAVADADNKAMGT